MGEIAPDFSIKLFSSLPPSSLLFELSDASVDQLLQMKIITNIRTHLPTLISILEVILPKLNARSVAFRFLHEIIQWTTPLMNTKEISMRWFFKALSHVFTDSKVCFDETNSMCRMMINSILLTHRYKIVCTHLSTLNMNCNNYFYLNICIYIYIHMLYNYTLLIYR